MPLNWIRAFASAAQYCSFTRAAQELHITQAAVSKQVRALEENLNCQLFKRHAHGLELTEQGRRYWQDTHELVKQLDQVTAQFLSRGKTHKIHIRCNISFSALVLTHKLRTFCQQHPEISFDITHDVWESGQTHGNTHIEIGYRLLEGFAPSEYARIFAQCTLQPAMAVGLGAEDLLKLPLIHVTGYYHEWSSWLKQIPEQHDHPLLQRLRNRKQGSEHDQDWFVDNSLTASQLATQGQGLILGRSYLLKNLLEQGQLQVIDGLPEIRSQEGFVISLTNLGQKHPDAVKLFEYLLASSA